MRAVQPFRHMRPMGHAQHSQVAETKAMGFRSNWRQLGVGERGGAHPVVGGLVVPSPRDVAAALPPPHRRSARAPPHAVAFGYVCCDAADKYVRCADRSVATLAIGTMVDLAFDAARPALGLPTSNRSHAASHQDSATP